MESTLLNLQFGKSHQSIELRKTFARIAFYCDLTMQGKKHEEILQLMEFSDDDWKYLLSVVAKISQLKDFDAKVCAAGQQTECFLGGTEIVKDNKVLMRL